MLEFFSGTAITSKIARSMGWNTVTIDFDPQHEATYCEDILTMDYTQLPAPDHLHASMDCTTYSKAAHGHHRVSEDNAEKFGLLQGAPRSETAHQADKLLARLLNEIIPYFLEINPRMTVCIENPEGY